MGTKKILMKMCDFDRLLAIIVDQQPAHKLLNVEGVRILVSACYENAVRRAWDREQYIARTAWATLSDRLEGPRLRWVRDQLGLHYDIQTRMLDGVLQVPLKKLGQAMEVLVEKYGVRRVIDMQNDDAMFCTGEED